MIIPRFWVFFAKHPGQLPVENYVLIHHVVVDHSEGVMCVTVTHITL